MGIVNGYEYFYDTEHHLANKAGIVYVHRVVAEDMLGRELRDEEVIHHMDGDRANNSPNNIMVFPSKSAHTKFHNPRSRIIIKCQVCGNGTLNKRYCSETCSKFGSRKVQRPSEEELSRDILEMSWVAMGSKYGVSDNAVRKWAKTYGLL